MIEKIAPRRVVTNHDTGMLAVMAIVCMLFDHVGAMFFPRELWMRIVGRIAFPLFAWGIAIGAEHTRNWVRYGMRLLIFGVLAQPFFVWCFHGPWNRLNIMATLFLGLAAIQGVKQQKFWLTALSLLVAWFQPMDYGIRGVLCILLLWATLDNPWALAGCFAAFCVMWGQSGSVILYTPWFNVRLQTTAILALPLMLLPKTTRTPTPKWLMYAVYPGHLAILYGVKCLLP